MKEPINIFWFKRDLRLLDNGSLNNAVSQKEKLLLIYCFEPSLKKNRHYSTKHWNFIKESLVDINAELDALNTKVLTVQSDIIGVFNQIQNFYKIDKVFSHIETGILVTYDRDRDFKRYCRNNNICWIENINNGVQRGLQNRETWFEDWNEYMSQPLKVFQPLPLKFLLS